MNMFWKAKVGYDIASHINAIRKLKKRLDNKKKEKQKTDKKTNVTTNTKKSIVDVSLRDVGKVIKKKIIKKSIKLLRTNNKKNGKCNREGQK